jgi:LysR family transcriptional regulator, glycine cleavage system transcriptional activator
LGRFTDKYPDIQLNIVTGLTFEDFKAAGTDVAVLYGDGNCPGYKTKRLLDEEIVPVIAPAHYQQADIMAYEHMQMATRPTAWGDWLQKHQEGNAPQVFGPKFENFTMMIEAVRSGMGVAVLPYMYVAQDIKEGRLLAPFGPPVTSQLGYYLATAEHLSDSPKTTAFEDWLFSQ